MEETLLKIGIGVLVPTVCAIFLKAYPKKKLENMIIPFADGPALLLSKVLNSKMGKKAANAVEEGPISTFLYLVKFYCERFEMKMKADNK